MIRPQSEIVVPAAINKDQDSRRDHHESTFGPWPPVKNGSTKQTRRLVPDGSTESSSSSEIIEGEIVECDYEEQLQANVQVD